MKIEWVDGFGIKTAIENGEIVISANREGMLSLAKQLNALADGVPGDHIHYDEYNSLEEGSTEMIIVMCHGDDPQGFQKAAGKGGNGSCCCR